MLGTVAATQQHITNLENSDLSLMVVLSQNKVDIPKSIVVSARGSLHVHGQLDGCGAELQARGAKSSEILETWVGSATRKPASRDVNSVEFGESRDRAQCCICVSPVVRHVVALGVERCRPTGAELQPWCAKLRGCIWSTAT